MPDATVRVQASGGSEDGGRRYGRCAEAWIPLAVGEPRQGNPHPPLWCRDGVCVVLWRMGFVRTGFVSDGV